jgi:O-antigen ligase/polysaccharide polymerase Wzy-like membrane protein
MWSAFERRGALFPLAAAGCLVAASAFISDGSSNGRLVWIGLASFALAAGFATAPLVGMARPVLTREAVLALGLLTAFVCWCGISVIWSIEPDRSWAYLNRGLVYVALAVLGLAVGAYVPQGERLWAFVLCVIVGLALGWALLGKAVPVVGGSGRIARLNSPIGYWNALALLFDFGLPLALWLASRRAHPHWLRAAGTVFLYALVVGVLLTYSRGGVAVAVVLLVAWLLADRARWLESGAALLLGGGLGALVGAWAFTRPGLAHDLQAHSVRVHDGAWFAVVFVLGACVVGSLAYLGSLAEARRELSVHARQLAARVAVGALAVCLVVGIAVVAATTSPSSWARDFTQQPANVAQATGPSRLGTISSTSRWQWWQEAWHAFGDQPLRGTGAGTFELTHRLLRTNDIVATEPHNLPLQFLTETGIVGALLAAGSLAAAGVGIVRRVRRLDGEERAVALALALGVLGFVLHALVDFDWDFVAVVAPFLVTAGVLLGGGAPLVREPRWTIAPVPAALAFAAAFSLLTPWFAQRSTNAALASLEAGRPAQAARQAHHARSLNPLSLEPLFVEAAAAEQLGDLGAARDLYVKAVNLQPLNWSAWYELGAFWVSVKNHEAAIAPLERAVELDPHGTLAPALLQQVRSR